MVKRKSSLELDTGGLNGAEFRRMVGQPGTAASGEASYGRGSISGRGQGRKRIQPGVCHMNSTMIRTTLETGVPGTACPRLAESCPLAPWSARTIPLNAAARIWMQIDVGRCSVGTEPFNSAAGSL